MSQITLPLYAKIGQVKPPRRVSAGGMDDAYIGGLERRNTLLAEGWEPPTCVDRGCFCKCHVGDTP